MTTITTCPGVPGDDGDDGDDGVYANPGGFRFTNPDAI
jgi:hypothetical protein